MDLMESLTKHIQMVVEAELTTQLLLFWFTCTLLKSQLHRQPQFTN